MPATRRRMLRTVIVGGSVSLVCVIFTFIYEQFSHGATSPHMRSMFLMPLVGLVLPCLIGLFTPLHRFVGRIAFNLWNSGLAVWTVLPDASYHRKHKRGYHVRVNLLEGRRSSFR